MAHPDPGAGTGPLLPASGSQGRRSRWRRSAVAAGVLVALVGGWAIARRNDDARRPAATSSSAGSTTPLTSASPIPGTGVRASFVPAGAYDRLPAPLPLAGTGSAVVLFGDSLVLQAYPYATDIARARGYRLTGGAYGGLALCDELASISGALRATRPAVLVLGFVGNAITPCMTRDGGAASPASIAARYARDARRAIAAANAVGADVWFVIPPVMRAPDRNAVALSLAARWQAIADSTPHVRVLDTAHLFGGPRFSARVACLPFETAALGCHNGSVVVRAADGTHLVPPDAAQYSPGAWRYAEVLVGGLAPRR